jgi:hypothetical protein
MAVFSVVLCYYYYYYTIILGGPYNRSDIMKKRYLWAWRGFIWLRTSSCNHGNEPAVPQTAKNIMNNRVNSSFSRNAELHGNAYGRRMCERRNHLWCRRYEEKISTVSQVEPPIPKLLASSTVTTITELASYHNKITCNFFYYAPLRLCHICTQNNITWWRATVILITT